MNTAIVGGGRMGLPLACVLADNGADVTVCDINDQLVDSVNAGNCPYEEPGLRELLEKVSKAGRLHASTETTQTVAKSEVIIIIVPAHLTPERDIDFSILKAVSADAGRGLQKGALVSYETTVSVGGTRQNLVPVLEEHSGLKAGPDFMVSFSPERVKANKVLLRLKETPKVVGGLDEASRQKAVEFYSRFLKAPVDDVGSMEAAELTKLAGMLYRDVNIALVNELAAFCEVADIDFELVRQASNRNGEANLLIPGIGVGGHCTPVYPYFLTRDSKRRGVTQILAEAARRINDAQPERYVTRLEKFWGSLEGKCVHILGLGFRPGVKVDTFSPAYPLTDVLHERDAIVTMEDPYYTDEEIREAGFEPAHAGNDTLDAVVLNTAHQEFAEPDFNAWHDKGVEIVVDGRNLWNEESVKRAGLVLIKVGNGIGSYHSTDE